MKKAELIVGLHKLVVVRFGSESVIR